MEPVRKGEQLTLAGIVVAVAIGYFTHWSIGVAIALVVLYKAGKSQLPTHIKDSGTSEKQPVYSAKKSSDAAPLNAPFAWPEPKNGDEFDIVGESNYQEALRTQVGDHGARESTQQFTAHIIPENDNIHDDKAVRVEINGATVGYLSRDDARSFRRRLGAKKLSDQITTSGARITGGWINKGGERVSYGVRLLIKPFW